MSRAYLTVKNFAAFQHYRDRNPPWIKSYTRLLEDYDFLALSDAARSQLMLIWLVASRTGNRIPDDRRWIARAIHSTSPVKLAELKDAGFLVPAETAAHDALADSEHGASEPLASVYQNAPAPRARGEGEGETEPTPPPPLRMHEETRAKIPESYWADLDRVLLHVTVPESLFATLESLNSGEITPPAFSWNEIGLGLHDLVANGKHEHFNARQLRRYVQGAREQMATSSAGTNGDQKNARAPMKPDAARAFDEAMRLLRATPWLHMTAEQIGAVDPATRAAVSSAGGWKELANADEIGLRIKRKLFIEAYHPEPHEVSA